MRLLRIVIALASVLAAPTFAGAAIYVWHDGEGVTHYVDNLDNVPADQREHATLLVPDWPRAAPQEEAVAPPPVAQAAPSAEPVSQVAARSFEEGVWAGRDSTIAAQPPPVNVTLGPIVQDVQVFSPSQLIPFFPVFEPAFPRRLHPRDGFVPSARGRFIHGPAGPPPLGAAGPPPLGAAGPPPVVFFAR